MAAAWKGQVGFAPKRGHKGHSIDFEEENINIAACEFRNGSKLSCSTVYQENVSRGWNEDIFPQVSER